MSPIDWTELTTFALELAEASAARILPFFRSTNRIDIKAGVGWDPVTEADRAGEEVIRRMIEARFPDHGIIGEEYGVKEARSQLTWILDPIDGTRAFICGMPTWATLIGLNVKDRPTLGLMNQPYVGETFYGNPDGAWSRHRGNTTRLAVRPPRPLAEAIVTTTAPELYRSEAEKAVLQAMTAATRLTRYGGDAYFFCLMAAGQVDIAMDAHMEIYDIAPLMPIIEGAGGVVTTWTRGNPSKGGNVIAASSRVLLDEALGVIAQPAG
jgi:histidinol phosphatase-like enzyme (inositol monophosphatase family)